MFVMSLVISVLTFSFEYESVICFCMSTLHLKLEPKTINLLG